MIQIKRLKFSRSAQRSQRIKKNSIKYFSLRTLRALRENIVLSLFAEESFNMKKIYVILFIFLLNSNIFGFSIIDRLNMPPNEKYYKKLSIQLNRLDKFIEKKNENTKKDVETF